LTADGELEVAEQCPDRTELARRLYLDPDWKRAQRGNLAPHDCEILAEFKKIAELETAAAL
jgi:hypothetical protein